MPGKYSLATTYLSKYLSLLKLSFWQASLSTSIIYVPGVTLTLTLRKSVDTTSTWAAMLGQQTGSIDEADKVLFS